MKLGPLVIQVEVSREPCQCGTVPIKATVPVTLSMVLVDRTCTFSVDPQTVRSAAMKALACKRCEL